MDGSVVVILQTTKYKLYRGLLSRHSAFFDKLFKDPFPLKKTEMVDGLPVLQMAGDSAEHFSAILDVLSAEPPEEPDFDTMAGVLELATKYGIKIAQSWARKALIAYLPTTLDEWRARRAYYDTDYEYTARIVQIGFQYDIREILPLPMYHLATGSMDDPNLSELKTLQLDSTIFQRLLFGRSKCQALATEYLALLPEYGFTVSQYTCQKGCIPKSPEIAGANGANQVSWFLENPLEGLHQDTMPETRRLWCSKCVAKNDKLYRRLLQKFFNKLPDIFDVRAVEVGEAH